MIHDDSGMGILNRIRTVWLLALGIKLALSAVIPLAPDETYYWFWGKHLQLSYYDHPPLVAWLFMLGTPFDSLGHASRWPAVILGHATFLVWLKILEPILTEHQRLWWLGLALVAPFFGVGSLIVTPDIPLEFFWSLALIALLKITENKGPFWYSALGCFLGLGFCSKYLIVLLVPAAFLWLIGTRRLKSIQWKWLPFTVLFGLLFSLPVLYWNYQHDFASFKFQIHHGLGAKSWDPSWTLEYIATQFGIIFPTIFCLALRKWPNRDADFLPYFGWFPILFFLWSSTRAPVEANWPTMAYPAIIALAVINARKATFLRITLAIWLFAIPVAGSEIVFDWLPVPGKQKLHEHARFDALIDVVSKREPVYAGSHQMASILSYKLRRNIYKLKGVRRIDFFDFLEESSPKSDLFYAVLFAGQTFPKAILESGYKIISKTDIGGEFSLYEVRRVENDTKD